MTFAELVVLEHENGLAYCEAGHPDDGHATPSIRINPREFMPT